MTGMTAPAPARPAPPAPPRRAKVVPIRPRRRWPWLVAAAAVAVSAVAAWRLAVRQAAPAGTAPAVRTTIVRAGTVERTLRVTGSIMARNSVLLLTPRLPGRGQRGGSDFNLVLDRLADAGSRVQKGDLVASFDTLHMMNRLDDYKAQVTQHETLIRRMRAQLDVKRVQHRQRILVAKARLDKSILDLKTAPVRSAIAVERFRLERDEARASHEELLKQEKLLEISEIAAIRRYELMLREATVEMERANANAARMTVRAPISGLVVLSSIRRGGEDAQVQAGDQLRPGHAFMQIVDTSSTMLSAALNQADVEDIRAGARARVHLDAYPGLEFPAKVINTGAFARPHGWRQAYVRTLNLQLQIEGADPRLLPDLSASADIVLESADASAVVPLEYVARDSAGPFVYVRHGDAWQRQPVDLGLNSHIHAAVVSGLDNGQAVGHPEDVAAFNRNASL
jgi:multidrug efflux pump subunit AcrA (membrane-fusion protein)